MCSRDSIRNWRDQVKSLSYHMMIEREGFLFFFFQHANTQQKPFGHLHAICVGTSDHLVDGIIHTNDFTDGQIQTIVYIYEDHNDPIFYLQKMAILSHTRCIKCIYTSSHCYHQVIIVHKKFFVLFRVCIKIRTT